MRFGVISFEESCYQAICFMCVCVCGGVYTPTHKISKYIWHDTLNAKEREKNLTVYSPVRKGGGKINFLIFHT